MLQLGYTLTNNSNTSIYYFCFIFILTKSINNGITIIHNMKALAKAILASMITVVGQVGIILAAPQLTSWIPNEYFTLVPIGVFSGVLVVAMVQSKKQENIVKELK